MKWKTCICATHPNNTIGKLHVYRGNLHYQHNDNKLVFKSLNFELVDEIQIAKNKHHKLHTLKHNELKSKKNN